MPKYMINILIKHDITIAEYAPSFIGLKLTEDECHNLYMHEQMHLDCNFVHGFVRLIELSKFVDVRDT